jgi:hypothetical protein
MDYSLLAGTLVTSSLLLLSVERGLSPRRAEMPRAFLIAYGAGLLCWLTLGVVMNHSALVLISALQIFFLITAATGTRNFT